MESNLGARRITRVKASSRALKIVKSKSSRQTYHSPHQMNTLMIFKNMGSLPPKSSLV